MGRATLESLPLVGGLVKMELEHQLQRHRPEIEAWALRLAFEALGLPNLADEKTITRESFSAALSAKINGLINPENTEDTGGIGRQAEDVIRLTNIFDKAATRRDLERVALAAAAREFGIKANALTVDGLKDALRDYVAEQVAQQLEVGQGDLIDGANELAALLKVIKAVRKEYASAHAQGLAAPPNPKRPLLMTPEAISNRRRQATYRSTHKRAWVPNGFTREAE